MKKILTKTNISLLIITLCAILFCGLFATSNITTKKMPMAHAESSATLKGATTAGDIWWTLLDYDIENLIITNTFDPSTAIGDPVDVSEEQNGSLNAYKVDNGNETYNCVIYANVDKIYAPENSKRLFSGYSGSDESILRNVKSITFENDCFDTSNAKDMQFMFSDCHMLNNFDVSKFNTSKVANMYSMFLGCNVLESLDVSKFDTSNVTDMSKMFMFCKKLTILDVSNFDTSKVTTFQRMFASCYKLTELNISSKLLSTGVYSWNTEKATEMSDMFGACLELKQLNISHFKTSQITSAANIQSLVGGCSKLEVINMSGFDFSSITDNTQLVLFGLYDEIVIQIYGSAIPEGQTLDEFLDYSDSLGNSNDATTIRAFRPCENLSEIYVPNSLGGNQLIVPIFNELYINGEESAPVQIYSLNGMADFYHITSAEEGVTIKTLNSSSATPNTGFASEQLLPMLFVGLTSLLAVYVCVKFNKKSKYNTK